MTPEKIGSKQQYKVFQRLLARKLANLNRLRILFQDSDAGTDHIDTYLAPRMEEARSLKAQLDEFERRFIPLPGKIKSNGKQK